MSIQVQIEAAQICIASLKQLDNEKASQPHQSNLVQLTASIVKSMGHMVGDASAVGDAFLRLISTASGPLPQATPESTAAAISNSVLSLLLAAARLPAQRDSATLSLLAALAKFIVAHHSVPLSGSDAHALVDDILRKTSHHQVRAADHEPSDLQLMVLLTTALRALLTADQTTLSRVISDSRVEQAATAACTAIARSLAGRHALRHLSTRAHQTTICALAVITHACDLFPSSSSRVLTSQVPEALQPSVTAAADVLLSALESELGPVAVNGAVPPAVPAKVWPIAKGLVEAARMLLVMRASMHGHMVRSRVRALMLAAARRAAQAADAEGENGQAGGSKGLSGWNWSVVEVPIVAPREVKVGDGGEEDTAATVLRDLCKEVSDVLAGCALAGRSTTSIANPCGVLPSPQHGATLQEQLTAVLCLGRMAVLAGTSGADQALATARVVINEFTTVLSTASGPVATWPYPLPVYACVVRTMAACAPHLMRNSLSWVYERVLNLMLRSYQEPKEGLGAALLFLSSEHTSEETPERGALADALEVLAHGMVMQPASLRIDFSRRLLALFSDLPLTRSLEPARLDMVALLPAMAIACRHASRPPTEPGSAAATAELTLALNDAPDTSEQLPPSASFNSSQGTLTPYQLQGLQVKDHNSIKLFRNVWLYCGILGLRNPPPPWLFGWNRSAKCMFALGELAAATPALVYGTGLAKEREAEQRAALELQPRLKAAGPAGSDKAIMDRLSKVLERTPDLPAGSPQTAFLLAISALETVRAEVGPLVDDPQVPPPVLYTMAYEAGAISQPANRSVFAALVRKSFRALLARLAASRPGDTQAYLHLERLAEVLIRAVCGSVEPAAADSLASGVDCRALLTELRHNVPSLCYSVRCLRVWLSLQSKVAGTSVERLLSDWLVAAATRAPTYMEHVLEQLLLDGGVEGDQSLVDVQPGKLLQALQSGRQASLMGQDPHGTISAFCEKSCALGRVATMAELLPDAVDRVRSAVEVSELRSADDGTLSPWTHADRKHCLDAAAMAVRLLAEGRDASGLVAAVCGLPLRHFRANAMTSIVFAWYWIVSSAPGAIDVLLAAMLPVWEATVQRCVGVFSGPYTASAAPLVPGDLQDWSPHDKDLRLVEGLQAHNLWAHCLLELWQGCQHRIDPSRASVLVSVMHDIVRSVVMLPANLCTHPLARAPLLRLLSLAFRFCTHMHRQTLRPGASGRTTAAWAGVDAATLFGGAIEVALQMLGTLPVVRALPEGVQEDEMLNAVLMFASDLRALQVEDSSLASEWAVHLELLNYLVEDEAQLQRLIVDPLGRVPEPPLPSSQAAVRLIDTAWKLGPHLAGALVQRLRGVSGAAKQLSSLVVQNASNPDVQAWPQGAVWFATAANALGLDLGPLDSWRPVPVSNALMLLSSGAGKLPAVQKYVMRCMSLVKDEELVFWLPQMVQSLRNDGGELGRFLVDVAIEPSHWMFLHKLIWALETEERPGEAEFNPEIKRSGWQPPKDTGLWHPCADLKARVLSQLDPEARAHFDAEHGTFQKVTDISGILKPIPKPERRSAIIEAAREIEVPRPDLYLPVNWRQRLIKLVPESGLPMQSAAKTPILMKFEVEEMPLDSVGLKDCGGPRTRMGCIFKVGDDCRQDVLALQIITVLRNAFRQAGLPLYLNPYGVLPTGYERGIIQLVPNTKSRASMGEMNDEGLYEIFQARYGAPGTPTFEAARENFILSEAGYAVASYLLQSKDRHNGNLLVDDVGRIVHIDFGFIFEISPGGNMKFESAEFKLSHEMAQLVDPGGERKSPQFQMFKSLCVKGFLAARTVSTEIMAVATLMAKSGLPCYGRNEPVDNLRARFLPDASAEQAAEAFRVVVDDAYVKWTTGFYDKIQNLQNDIPF